MTKAAQLIKLYGEDMEQALFYEGPYYMFSNFSSFMVEWDGIVWPTSEHAYQAAKFTDHRLRENIRDARSAHDAKNIARAHDSLKCADWESVKLFIMEEILRCKLHQHPFIEDRLLKTGNKVMVEDSPKDSFWGRGPDWKGKNHLGKLWMKLRDELHQSYRENYRT